MRCPWLTRLLEVMLVAGAVNWLFIAEFGGVEDNGVVGIESDDIKGDVYNRPGKWHTRQDSQFYVSTGYS